MSLNSKSMHYINNMVVIGGGGRVCVCVCEIIHPQFQITLPHTRLYAYTHTPHARTCKPTHWWTGIWTPLGLLHFQIDGEDVRFYMSLSIANRKWKPVPDDMASIRKSTLRLEFLASDRNAKAAWISGWAERQAGSVELKKSAKHGAFWLSLSLEVGWCMLL